MILDKIRQPNDIKKLNPDEYALLAQEIRTFLIRTISENGGHLGSNLGAVELTMALHLSLNLPEDKIIFDVGHQSYTHKLLTGRRDDFVHLRKFHGLSGFPKHRESDCDAFDTGHSSTSLSAGLGLVKARDLKHENHTVISVIGDGALTGGMAYEALNNASKLTTNFIMILNDNNRSISENVGGISRYLQNIRTAEGYQDFKLRLQKMLLRMPQGKAVVDGLKRYKSSIKQLFVPGMFFEDMGITYLGPVDGHDIRAMMKLIKEAKRINHAVLIHVRTKKGRGYAPAERHPARFHGTDPFDIETGLPRKNKEKPGYTDVFSTVMIRLAAKNPRVCAISAAMPDGTGLTRFSKLYPDRFFDVGIAEEHAVTFAAGLSAGGMIPVVAIYSSFLQRAYDQIIHDVCIQKLHVIFAVDRAGIVGADGETHQGIFDLSFLSSIPNMVVAAPKNKWELSDLLKFAAAFDGPMAVRYPRGEACDDLEEYREKVVLGKSEKIYEGRDVALLAVGSMVKTAIKVRENLEKEGISAGLFNARFVKPLDEDMVREAGSCPLIVTMEENVLSGGFGEKVRGCADVLAPDSRIIHVAIPDAYVEHGNVELLKQEIGIDDKSVTERIIKELKEQGRNKADKEK
ncbi:MAG: 1-deoxy-D-xylulose-5-phosphate synthase [Lachnospiraceae bacterium]|nr:1-deoxy-D-xylulose-5-phosphate synthase [Lachnospiraceae bacterium]